MSWRLVESDGGCKEKESHVREESLDATDVMGVPGVFRARGLMIG